MKQITINFSKIKGNKYRVYINKIERDIIIDQESNINQLPIILKRLIIERKLKISELENVKIINHKDFLKATLLKLSDIKYIKSTAY